MKLDNAKTLSLIVDSHNGIYTPQIFAERNPWLKDVIGAIDYKLLLNPEGEFYWETFEEALTIKHEGRCFFQNDGDVFSISEEEFALIDWGSIN